MTENNSNYELLRFASLTSTNDFLKQPLPEGVDLSLPVFVLADEQTKGRGRLGRNWQSKPGGVYLSLLWPEILDAQTAVSLPLLTALAVRAAIQPLTEQKIVIKWPNDLLVEAADDRRKLVGILVELHDNRAIIGIGVNVLPFAVDSTGDDNGGLPIAWLAPSATNSDLLEQVVGAIIPSLIGYLQAWQNQGMIFAPFAQEYRNHMILLGEYVEIRNADRQLLVAGRLSGIDDYGLLIVESTQGTQLVSSGEVTFRRNT